LCRLQQLSYLLLILVMDVFDLQQRSSQRQVDLTNVFCFDNRFFYIEFWHGNRLVCEMSPAKHGYWPDMSIGQTARRASSRNHKNLPQKNDELRAWCSRSYDKSRTCQLTSWRPILGKPAAFTGDDADLPPIFSNREPSAYFRPTERLYDCLVGFRKEARRGMYSIRHKRR